MLVFAGIVAYHTEQEFGTWHMWVPIIGLKGSGGTADEFVVLITASELSVGVSNCAPFLEVIPRNHLQLTCFPCHRLYCIFKLGHNSNDDT